MKKFQYFRLLSQIFFLSVFVFSFSWFKLPYERQAIVGGTLLIGSFYCGWMCNFGALQEWIGWIGTKVLGKKLVPPKKIDQVLSLLRYAAPILGILLITNSLNARTGLFNLFRGKELLNITLYSVIFFLILSLIVDRPFCRWFCPQGAMYGIVSFLRIFTIKRNSNTCIQCKQCDRSCPMGIEVSTSEDVLNPQCVDCFKCLSHCPKGSETLTFALRDFKKKKSFLLLLIPIGILLFFLVMQKLGLRSGPMH